MCSFHLCIFAVEYSTEKDLLKSLENGSVDQIWLFECKAKPDFPLMVVKVHHEAPEIGVQITTRETEDGRHFSHWVKDNPHHFVEEDGYDDEYCKYLLNMAPDQNIRMAEAHCVDVRNFHFPFYFTHQLSYCLEFSDTKTPILHELNLKKTAKIEISTLKLVFTIASPVSVLCM